MDREPGCRRPEMLMVICTAHGRIHTRPLNRSSHYCYESNEDVKLTLQAEWAESVFEPSQIIVTMSFLRPLKAKLCAKLKQLV